MAKEKSTPQKKQRVSPVKRKTEGVPVKEYASTLAELKRQVRDSQLKAALSVNVELIRLYWNMGKTIAEKQEVDGWGTNVIENLAKDLQNEFPGIQGFSRANVFRMRTFYRSYQKVAQAVRQFEKLPVSLIPWGHNILLIQKLENEKERLWYAQKTIEHGWSRSELEDWIKSKIYHGKGKAVTNFAARLPPPQSRLAQETLKDPYNFDFLALGAGYKERELEQGLVDHIQKFLIELGHGFAFVGRQYQLEVADTAYYIDLLFYHLKLRCYVVVELKNTAFKPEYAGKLNFYLSAVDDLLRHEDDKPTIGMLLCKTKNNLTVEYALRGIKKPIGVSEYGVKILEKLPKALKGTLPTVEEFEAEIGKGS